MADTDADGSRSSGAHTASEEPESVTRIQRQYVRVIVLWVGVLAALYAFQELFS
jgi:hypothetical protein